MLRCTRGSDPVTEPMENEMRYLENAITALVAVVAQGLVVATVFA